MNGWAFVALMGLALTAGCSEPPAETNSAGGDQISRTDLGPWRLSWQDEFDGASGELPNSAHWNHDVGGDGWGNEQLEYDTAAAANGSLDGQGHLLITARAEPYAGRAFTSARLNTNQRFAQAYGRFEARIRMPQGKGLWPAFWLLGANYAEANWPACGEIDIVELRGSEPRVAHGSLHGPGFSGGRALTLTKRLESGTFADGFHVFATEWSPDRIRWYVDDVAYQERTRESVSFVGEWVFDHPFFAILNLAVGGRYDGAPDASTVFPQVMTVDYVRVYTHD